MKNYLLLDEKELVISNNTNYILKNSSINATIKEGVTTNILSYGSMDKFDLNIKVEKDATINIYQILQEEKELNVTGHVDLNESGATCNVIIVLLGKGKAKINSSFKIYHNVNNTDSDFKVYAIVKDKAEINLDNNAFIKQGSYQSNAYQSAKGLSLSKDGQILVNPNLFIDEYDVMASHGVAMGSLNQDDLFYLMSRGLTMEEASHIVIMGFIEPLLIAIDNEELTNGIREEFLRNLD